MAAPPILFKTGIHSARPAASAGTVHYYCTTHSKLEQSDGTTWSDLYDFSTLAGLADPMTTRGDTIVRNASNVTARLAVGAAGTYYKSDGTDVAWVAGLKRSVNFVIDGGGSTITTGVKGDVEIPFAWTDIASVRLLADQSGSIVVDIWKDTYANFPPVSGDKITASAPPTISTATKAEDTTLTGWTKTGSAGDILRFNVTSVTTIQRVTLSLVLVPA